MIKLNIEPYCENCEAFDPIADLNKNEERYFDPVTLTEHARILCNTEVRCSMKNICKNIHKYIVKEETKANGKHN